VKSVIDAVASITSISSRKSLVSDLESLGVDPGVAQWMTTNVTKDSSGSLKFMFDVPTVRSLYSSYSECDYLPLLASLSGGPTTVHLVRATRNEAWAHVEGEMAALTKGNPNVVIHDVDSGHWVHQEKMREVVDLIKPTIATR
jgi:hypothetical protein